MTDTDHVARLRAMLAQLDKFDGSSAAEACRCDRSQNILGEILLVSVDCDFGHGIPVGAGGATGEDLRAVLDELERLRAERVTACVCGCRRSGRCKCGPVGKCDCAWDCPICDRADSVPQQPERGREAL